MSDEQPNVLFLMSDQHSFRHLGHVDDGGEEVQTPGFDQLAASSTRFENAYCSTPLCTPSRLSLLTGREAKAANAFGNSCVLPPELPTLPGTFSEAGYETCLVGKMHLGGNRQFVGFDHRPYGDLTGNTTHQGEPPQQLIELINRGEFDWKRLLTEVGETAIPESLLQEQNVVQETLSFLREHRHRNGEQPWFLCASFSRPHWPRTAPRRHLDRYWPDDVSEPKVTDESATYDHPFVKARAESKKSREITEEEMLRARAAYFACVDYLDEIIGSLLHQLEQEGFLENTIVVYTSDHGELAGEHGLWEKATWHEASVRVPLFIQLPEHRTGEAAAASLETPVSLLDLYPTLCGIADIQKPEMLDGVDHTTAIRSGSEPEARPIFVDGLFENSPPQFDYRMVRDGKYKYVRFRDAPELLFDLEADPLETENLLDRGGEDVDQIHERLQSIVTDSLDFEDVTTAREQSDELKAKYKLATPKGGPNQYHLPDGRIVDADTPLYHPHTITESPESAFADYPTPDGDAPDDSES